MKNDKQFQFRVGRFHILAIAIILTILSIANAITAKADPVVDKYAYLASLESAGIHLGTDDYALGIGHAVCEDMDDGSTLLAEVGALVRLRNMSVRDAGWVVGSAAAAFCPKYSPHTSGSAWT